MHAGEINKLAGEIFAQNVERGWWDNMDRDIYQTLQLVNTEIAEATEGDRKNLMDDHLPHRKMPEVELADTLIRLLDLAGRYKWEYSYIMPHSMLSFMITTAGRHLVISICVTEIALAVHNQGTAATAFLNRIYSVAIETILEVAKISNYNLRATVAEKLAYNKVRADHSREHRAEFDGKKY